MKNFYKIGFFALLALILMASSSLPSLLEVKPTNPKSTAVFITYKEASVTKINSYLKHGYVFKSATPIDTKGGYSTQSVLVVMEKY